MAAELLTRLGLGDVYKRQVSERARVLELGGGDAVEERLERGLERIADAVPRPRG